MFDMVGTTWVVDPPNGLGPLLCGSNTILLLLGCKGMGGLYSRTRAVSQRLILILLILDGLGII